MPRICFPRPRLRLPQPASTIPPVHIALSLLVRKQRNPNLHTNNVHCHISNSLLTASACSFLPSFPISISISYRPCHLHHSHPRRLAFDLARLIPRILTGPPDPPRSSRILAHLRRFGYRGMICWHDRQEILVRPLNQVYNIAPFPFTTSVRSLPFPSTDTTSRAIVFPSDFASRFILTRRNPGLRLGDSESPRDVYYLLWCAVLLFLSFRRFRGIRG